MRRYSEKHLLLALYRLEAVLAAGEKPHNSDGWRALGVTGNLAHARRHLRLASAQIVSEEQLPDQEEDHLVNCASRILFAVQLLSEQALLLGRSASKLKTDGHRGSGIHKPSSKAGRTLVAKSRHRGQSQKLR